MTYEYTAYVSSGRVNSGNEVLRVTAEGEFIWHENADEMIESADYSQYPALRHVLKALREAERIKAENERLRSDAELYRYLRNRDPAEVLGKKGKAAGVWIDCEDEQNDLQLLTGDDADAAIREAIKEAALQEQPK